MHLPESLCHAVVRTVVAEKVVDTFLALFAKTSIFTALSLPTAGVPGKSCPAPRFRNCPCAEWVLPGTLAGTRRAGKDRTVKKDLPSQDFAEKRSKLTRGAARSNHLTLGMCVPDRFNYSTTTLPYLAMQARCNEVSWTYAQVRLWPGF